MHLTKRFVIVPGAALALALGLGLAALAASQAGGAAARSGQPTAVATVDLPMVLDGLQERAAKEGVLAQLAEEILAADEEWKARLAGLRQRIEETPASDEAAQATLRDELALATLEHEEWRRFKYDSLDIEKSILLRGLYKSVMEAIAELAEVGGYDLVLLDDARTDLAINPEIQMPREAQVKQQMLTRNVLYASPAIDITPELIQRMNNAFAARH